MNNEKEAVDKKIFDLINVYRDSSRKNNKLSEVDIETVTQTLLNLEYFQKLHTLIGSKGLELFAKQLKLQNFYQDEIILKYGDDNANFYLVLQGEIDIFENKLKEAQINVGTLKQGQTFGDFFTSTKKKSILTTVCSRDAVIASISHVEILLILSSTDQLSIERCTEILKKFGVFAGLSRNALDRFYFTIEKKKYHKGDIVFKEGDDVLSNGLYFIYAGEFLVTKSVVKKSNKLKDLNKEIESLGKETNVLLTCLRGYNPDSALIKSLYENIKKPQHEHIRNFTMKLSTKVNILIVKEGEYFGDIELSFSDNDQKTPQKRKLTVSCISENATVYYTPFSKFLKLINFAMKERIIHDVIEKRRVLNKRYEDAVNGVDLFKEEKKFKLFASDNKIIVLKKERKEEESGRFIRKIEISSNAMDSNLAEEKYLHDMIKQTNFKFEKSAENFLDKRLSIKWIDSKKKLGKSSKELPWLRKTIFDFRENADVPKSQTLTKPLSIFNSKDKRFSGVLNLEKYNINLNKLDKNYIDLSSGRRKTEGYIHPNDKRRSTNNLLKKLGI